ncbi:TetR/AcrR family transcriptional regulator [Subtercola endophyticus]|uniref:TetR/AcrR family transcriptional regulator n=1 Tax=Subtercola endophyticus TaxID=2895559 RepID=UPI001E4921B9|nr:TetR/AcrR family transcriptional regulator [Subtercola endophyticus]UFS60808.1 TetR/AcrR family transcriptional regulator [Subtercola endophyticus]
MSDVENSSDEAPVSNSKRTYSSPLRQADAEATRHRIVDAASLLFTRDGYGVTTMRAIADQAGVSVQTVHLHGPKADLLMATYEMALAQREGFDSLNEDETMQWILASPDLNSLLDRYSSFMTIAIGRIAALVRTIRAAADTDPAVRHIYDLIEERRVRSIQEGVHLLAAKGVITPESVDDVITMIGLLVSADTYTHFIDSGWTPERYHAWLHGQLETLAASVRTASAS